MKVPNKTVYCLSSATLLDLLLTIDHRILYADRMPYFIPTQVLRRFAGWVWLRTNCGFWNYIVNF